ncbi:hypothetical protein BU17DRAFT_51939, partial [Hysterangium stoloniferum]
CPYLPGCKLDIDFYPVRNQAFSQPIRLKVEISHPYTPFTNSQALKARVISSHPEINIKQDSVLCLKLFDRRFVERTLIKWSPRSEMQLRQRVMKHLSKHGPTTSPFFVTRGILRSSSSEDGVYFHPDFCPPTLWDHTRHAIISFRPLWEREVYLYGTMLYQAELEAAIYCQLDSLQGTRIPHLYGFVSVRLPEGIVGDDITSCVPGLAIEYIDGTTLDGLHIGQNVSEEEAEQISQRILTTFREIRKWRVMHCDVRRANILVRNSDLSPFIIDFGSAYHKKSETEEEWAILAAGVHDIKDARDRLEMQGLHLPSPLVTEPDASSNGFRVMNKQIESSSETWRKKYVEPLETPVPSFEIRKDSCGREYEWEYPRWRIKEGVNTYNFTDF